LAVPPTTEEAFLREVDEELRRDTLQGFWNQWGKKLIGLLVIGLLLFGGWLWWQERALANSGREGEELSLAVEELSGGNNEAATKIFEKLKTSEVPGHRALSKLAIAGLAYQKEDLKSAVAGYDAVANDSKLDAPWRDVATIRKTAAQFDTIKPEEVVARLKPLAVSGNPWFGSAGEMTAIAYLRMGKPELAGKLFAEISKDEQVPESIRSRAVQMAGTLGVDAVNTATKEDK
jgi:hypothetical protein